MYNRIYLSFFYGTMLFIFVTSLYRIQEIASLVNVPKKSQLIQRLIAYWTLKRQFRNGVPLLRRLQSSHLARRDDPLPLQEVVSDTVSCFMHTDTKKVLFSDVLFFLNIYSAYKVKR